MIHPSKSEKAQSDFNQKRRTNITQAMQSPPNCPNCRKPKGFAKIWREIKRPFKKVRREIIRPLRQLWRICVNLPTHEETNGADGLPTSVCIDASTLCQLNCPSCYMRLENSGGVGKGFLKYKDFKKFLDDHKFIKRIELSNSGEVFLNPELPKIIKYAVNARFSRKFLKIITSCDLEQLNMNPK